MTMTTGDLPARLERLPLTRYQWLLFSLISTAFFFDCLDVAVLTFVLAPLSTTLHLSTAEAGLVASATFVGMAIGASLAGVVSDRFGRRPVFTYSILFWGVASLLTALSWNLGSVLTFRLLTGIGLGAELPVAQALLSEFLPAGRRGRYMGWMQGSIPLAFLVGGGLSLLIVPSIGWRWVFVVMFAFAMIALILRQAVPESPRWCDSRGYRERAEKLMAGIESRVAKQWGKPLPPVAATAPRTASATDTSPLREILRGGYVRRTALAWGMWLFAMLGYYAIVAWMAKLLVDNGMSVASSIAYVLAMYAWGVPGFLAASYLLERLGRKPVVTAAIVLSAAAAYLYGGATSIAAVVVAGSLLQFCLMGMWVGIYTYTPELFPTRARATGSGTASTAGRVGAIVGPALVPPLLANWGHAATFAFFSAFFVVAAILVLWLGPETKGRVLEDVSS